MSEKHIPTPEEIEAANNQVELLNAKVSALEAANKAPADYAEAATMASKATADADKYKQPFFHRRAANAHKAAGEMEGCGDMMASHNQMFNKHNSAADALEAEDDGGDMEASSKAFTDSALKAGGPGSGPKKTDNPETNVKEMHSWLKNGMGREPSTDDVRQNLQYVHGIKMPNDEIEKHLKAAAVGEAGLEAGGPGSGPHKGLNEAAEKANDASEKANNSTDKAAGGSAKDHKDASAAHAIAWKKNMDAATKHHDAGYTNTADKYRSIAEEHLNRANKHDEAAYMRAKSEGGVGALDCAASSNPIRSIVPLSEDVIMYMPGGTHTITPSQNGKAVTVTVEVTEASAGRMEEQRKALDAVGKKPFFSLQHDTEIAAFWPSHFFWDKRLDATGSFVEGVWAEGIWTKSGREAVEGRDFRTFSPTFFVDSIRNDPSRPCQVVCNADARANMGALENDPAFQEMSPLWARSATNDLALSGADKAGAPGIGETNNNTDNMDEKLKAELQARNQQLERTVAELKAKNDQISKSQLEAAQAELKSNGLQLELAKKDERMVALEAAEAKRKEQDADKAVETMVSAGLIPTMAKEVQASYRDKFIGDPSLIPLVLNGANKAGAAISAGRVTPGAVQLQAGGKGVSRLDYNHGAPDLTGGLKGMVELMAASGKGSSLPDKHEAARQVGQIYKREVQPLFARGVTDFPLEAATSADNIGTLSGTLVALRTLDLYKFEFPMLDSITTDFSDQPAQFNQTTSTRIIVVPAVISYDATIGGDGRPAGWTIVTQAQTVDANITLNRHRAVDLIFDANTLASTQRRLFEEQGPAAAYAIGKDVVDYIYTLITFANFGNTAGDNAPFAVAALNYGRPTFAKAKRILNKQGAPFMNRFALSNSDYQEMLEQDPTLVSLAVFQKPEIITNSELPQIAKFRPLEAPNLPATAITGFGALSAFFAHKSALLMQARIPNDWNTVLGPGQGYGSVNVVTNPDTGLSVLMVQFSNPQSSHAEYRLALMYGAAKGNSKGGVIVTT